jgi:membrane protease YdiL (CAAX protease family)
VSYGLGTLGLFLAGTFAPGPNSMVQLYLGRLFVVAGPACGAIAALLAGSGRSAIRPFLRQALSWPASWWTVLLLPVAGVAIVMTAYLAAGMPFESWATAICEAWPLLLGHVILQILIVGTGEELGWRGWLLPTLAAKHGLVRASALTGAVWYFWHLPILLGGVADAFWFALAIGGLTILLSVLWVRSGRTAVVPAIAHGSINAPVVFITAMAPHADHRLAWSILCGMLAALGLVTLICIRGPWLKPTVPVA